MRYLLVDEVQEMADWARTINSLRTALDLEITVTGSNASMFAGKGLTYLAGLYVAITVFPLSLSEFRQFRRVPTETSAEQSYREWVEIGGFPASALSTDARVTSQLNDALFDSIFTRDIALREQLRDTAMFLKVARTVVNTIGSPMSVNKMVNTLASEGFTTNSPVRDVLLVARF
ncbi:MAG: AAA family ATPase [Corynebacterium sp.]|uniref:AAA family ATPase n=1 Tax=Corynebacterium sp. TaxID=1720 RepID=UPI0026DEB97F|nr:AAA family ATPase [Corynebacterium sp.]MDO5670734.1 AAA family ATPase [Corynebacterium sp.]